MLINKTIKLTFVIGTMTPLMLLSGTSYAAARTVSSLPANPNSNAAQALTAAQQQDLSNLKTRGAAEITRRLTSLNQALTKINATTKLSSTDKTYLINEINTEIAGLTALKTTLAGETELSAARTDVKSIYSDYRVYALVLPKSWLVTVSDGEVNVTNKLSTLSTKIQTQINSAKAAGKNVDAIQTQLDSMIASINSAQSIASSVQTKVINLQPTDYNSDHTILSGYKNQLQTVHTDNQTAYNDAKNIINSLKSL